MVDSKLISGVCNEAERMYEVEIGGRKVMVNELVYEELLHDSRDIMAEIERMRKGEGECGE